MTVKLYNACLSKNLIELMRSKIISGFPSNYDPFIEIIEMIYKLNVMQHFLTLSK